MLHSAPVMVQRRGFLSTVAQGAFVLLTTGVICGTLLGAYGLHLLDSKFDRLLSLAETGLEVLPRWKEAMPPAVADALNDRRDPSYRDNLRVTLERGDSGQTVLRIRNAGTQAVSLLALRIVARDGSDEPVADSLVYAATPLAIDRDWSGPLMPGDERVLVRRLPCRDRTAQVTWELAELRVWSPDAPVQSAPTPAVAAAPQP